MIDFQVIVDPVTFETFDKLEDLGGTLRAGGFNQKVGQAILSDGIRPYPPPPPNSTYVRTFKLFNSWHLILPAVSGGGDLFIVQSASPDYNGYVQQRSTQAWMHRNRWQTEEDVAEEKEAWVAAEMTTFIGGILP